MPNIASALRAEIQRIARKTIRDETSTLKKTIAPYRSEIAALKRRTQVLEQQLKRSQKAVSRVAAPRREEEQEPSGIRFSAKGLSKNRQRLGLSAADFGTLIGASGQSVYKWEEGKSRPRHKNLAAIAAIRSIGKKEALARLAHAMFDMSILQFSPKVRSGTGQWIAELVATAGLLLVILRAPAARVAAMVAAYIGSAYFFTASTSFANPAAAFGRMFTDSFAGIAPSSVPAFIGAQLIGAGLAVAINRTFAGAPIAPEVTTAKSSKCLTSSSFTKFRERAVFEDPPVFPALDAGLFDEPTQDRLLATAPSQHRPRFLLLYGSLRERSYSRLVTFEAARLLTAMGGEVKVFDPAGLPLADDAPDTHPKVQELRKLAQWSEGMVWCSPERHGAMTGIMKTQIDWIPLSSGAVRPTQGKTLAVMQVSGGSQSFNAVNQMRILGRWMRMITIPNQSSVAKAYNEFTDEGRMKPSAYYDRVVDVMEELFKFTLLTRDVSPYLVDRYSERKESAEKLSRRVNQQVI